MRISYINLSTLICCFLPVILKTHSIKGTIILFNGILYHTHVDNKLLFFYDIIINIGFIADTYYYNPHIRNQISFASFLAFINIYMNNQPYQKYRLSKNTHDFFHSLITHIYGSYLLYLSY